MEFVQTVIPYILEILAYAAITAIGVCGAYLSAKAAKGKHLANIAAAIEQVTIAAQAVVGELQQTVVGVWKEQAEDGKLTAQQINQLKAALLTDTRNLLAAPVISLLEAAKVDINALITSVGEDAIRAIHAKDDYGAALAANA